MPTLKTKKHQQYMNLTQAAVYIGVSYPTLKILLKRGLKHAKVGSGAYRVSKQWCDEYMVENIYQGAKTKAKNIVAEMFSTP